MVQFLVGQTKAIKEKKKQRKKNKGLDFKYLFSENLLCEDCLHSAQRAGLYNNLKQRNKILSSSFLISSVNLFY